MTSRPRSPTKAERSTTTGPRSPGPTTPNNRGQLITQTADGDVRHNGLVYRSPVINISRHPLWGRIDEAFGEDPFLTSRMTVAFVKGTHGDHPRYLKLATTLKHYAVNNQEIGRRSLSADRERTHAHGVLPAALQGGHRGGRRDVDHVVVQPHQRRHQHRKPAAAAGDSPRTSGSSRGLSSPTAARPKTWCVRT